MSREREREEDVRVVDCSLDLSCSNPAALEGDERAAIPLYDLGDDDGRARDIRRSSFPADPPGVS